MNIRQIESTDTSPDKRVQSLLAEYGAEDASAAWLFCDRHDPRSIAFTMVNEDGVFEIKYGQLREQSTRLAAGLRALGVAEGDRVATLLGKRSELVVALLAIWRLGAVYVPLFTAFAADAIEYRLLGAEVTTIITDPDQRGKLPHSTSARVVVVGDPVDRSDIPYADLVSTITRNSADQTGVGVVSKAPIVQIFTSGTTGSAKSVLHPLSYAAGWHSYLEFGLGMSHGRRFWCAADPGWAYGLYAGLIAPLAAGVGTILVAGGFSTRTTWDVVRRLEVTDLAAAPTVYRSLRADEQPTGKLSLERLSSAGEPLTPDISEWSEVRLGLKVHDHFGQTEVGMVFANPHHPQLRREIVRGSMGLPLPGWAAVVLREDGTLAPAGEVGRIAIDVQASPLMTFRDYAVAGLAEERFTHRREHYLLGDLGRRDMDSRYSFVARDDDVIIMAGYRIGPFDVESVLATHPAVVECAVIAAPDEVRGEVVEAYVVLHAGSAATESLIDELQNIVRSRYAAHAYPRQVHFVPSLPKTPSGKIQRHLLRRMRREEATHG